MDPYRVLNVDRNASDDEIKKAYRKLSRVYHPDANVNNPNKEAAEERFKEVQQAYDKIMKERQQGGAYSGSYSQSYGEGPFGGFQGRYYYGSRSNGSEEDAKFSAAMVYIRNRQYAQAINVLNAMSGMDNNAAWHYYYSLASSGMGNSAEAIAHIKRAVELEPSNITYRNMYNAIINNGSWYNSMGSSYERPYSGSKWCLEMLLLNLFCECCCRPI